MTWFLWLWVVLAVGYVVWDCAKWKDDDDDDDW